MTKYEKELQALKPHDEVQSTSHETGKYDFIYTAGHGYLVVPKEDKHYQDALKICSYGFKGDHAVYLEEDCELWEFINKGYKPEIAPDQAPEYISKVINAEHLRAMTKAMIDTKVIKVMKDNNGVKATATTKAGEVKEIFRALKGSNGTYLARYCSNLFV